VQQLKHCSRGEAESRYALGHYELDGAN